MVDDVAKRFARVGRERVDSSDERTRAHIRQIHVKPDEAFARRPDPVEVGDASRPRFALRVEAHDPQTARDIDVERVFQPVGGHRKGLACRPEELAQANMTLR